MTNPGYSRVQPTANRIQPVGIVAVDPASNTATAMTLQRSQLSVDLRWHVGSVQVTPSVGEQWLIRYLVTPIGSYWVLDSKIPFGTAETLTPVTEGQQQIGNGRGPIQLLGTQINVNGPLGVQAVTTAERPTGAPAGTHLFDTTLNKPIWSTGTGWVDGSGTAV
jgi:hypothetical protein